MSWDIDAAAAAAGDNGVTPRPAGNGALSPKTGAEDEADSAQRTDPGSPEAPSRPADLQIRLNDDPALGFCVYALRPFRRGERLYEERAALEATHDAHKGGVRNVYERYRQLSAERRRALHGSFPHLAWANGVDAREAAAARTMVGSLLTTKSLVLDNRLTAADHMRMRPDWGLPAADECSGSSVTGSPTATATARARTALLGLFHRKASQADLAGPASGDEAERRARTETLDWFSRYAFRIPPDKSFVKPGGNYQAAVYLLTDLMNHRCNGLHNCHVRAGLGTIAVLADRDIAAGEEVTINYRKDVKDFLCRAECCARK